MPYARFRFKNIPKIENYDLFNNVFLNKSYARKLWNSMGDVYFPRKYNYGNYTFEGKLDDNYSTYKSKIVMSVNPHDDSVKILIPAVYG
jgi:hypothetical protein